MIPWKQIRRVFCAILLPALVTALLCVPARAAQEDVPPEVMHGIDLVFNGDPDAAIPIAKQMEEERPDYPLGYLLELEALWWKTYCEACEVKWGMVDAWGPSREPEDQQFLALADKAIALAKAQLAKSESAEMHLFAGMGYAFKTRLYAVRDEHRGVARSGVAAHDEFAHALELDPEMYDADAGLGIYNYYADALSGFIKILRFFMGIPGGSRKQGIQQLEIAMEKGQLMKAEARFYLARNLRTYDQRYERAEQVLIPLAEEYPHNPLFQVWIGNLNVELNRKVKAAAAFRAAQASASNSPCGDRLNRIAEQFLLSIGD